MEERGEVAVDPVVVASEQEKLYRPTLENFFY